MTARKTTQASEPERTQPRRYSEVLAERRARAAAAEEAPPSPARGEGPEVVDEPAAPADEE